MYIYICTYIYTKIRLHTHIRRHTATHLDTQQQIATHCTGWRRPIGCLKLHVISRKRATNYRALLRKMTCKDKASHGPSPPCNSSTLMCARALSHAHTHVPHMHTHAHTHIPHMHTHAHTHSLSHPPTHLRTHPPKIYKRR